MKIIIEPSEDQTGENYPRNTVLIESVSDDLTVGEAMENLVKALQAWGYHRENISEYLDEEFAYEIGVTREKPRFLSNEINPNDSALGKDTTSECGGV